MTPAATAGELLELDPRVDFEPPDRFTTEPVLAWRHWVVNDDDGLLHSAVWRRYSWPPRERLEAICGLAERDLQTPRIPHRTPSDLCKCGIHGWKTAEQALADLAVFAVRTPRQRGEHVRAIGRVSLWGRVKEREKGYKAQYAYPYEVIVPGAHRARRLRETYGVDVVALDVDEPIFARVMADELGEPPEVTFTEALLRESRNGAGGR